MCIIFTAREGSFIPEQDIRDGWMLNPHGAGIAWAAEGVVQFRKGFMKLDQLLEAVAAIPPGAAHLIHMRYTSSGGTDERYTHPFGLDPKDPSALFRLEGSAPRVFAHNGTVPKRGLASAWSDSQHLAWEISKYPKGYPPGQDFSKDMRHTRGVILDGSGRMRYKGKWIPHPDIPGIMMSNRGAWPVESSIEAATQLLVREFRGEATPLVPLRQWRPTGRRGLLVRTGRSINDVTLVGDIEDDFPLPLLVDDQEGYLYQDVGIGDPVLIGRLERYEAAEPSSPAPRVVQRNGQYPWGWQLHKV